VLAIASELFDPLPEDRGHQGIMPRRRVPPRQCRLVRILVLGAGPGQLGLLAAARARDLFVIAVDRDPAAPGFRFADRRAIVSLDDEPALERLAEAERVDGVIAPGSDLAVGAAARIAARFRLPHPISPSTAVLSSSKLRQRERLEQEGVPQTRWKVVTKADDELGFPCVVKPTDRHARRGLTLVRTQDELREAVQAALRASRSGLCLVEELAHGPEVTVTGFSSGGCFHPLTVMDRLPLAHIWPSHHGDFSAELAKRAVRALGIEEGASTTLLRLTPEGPRVVEVGARVGGGHDPELCETALGVDLNGLALSAALGEEIEPERLAASPRVSGACVYFIAGGTGEPEGLERAAAAPGVEWARVYPGSDRRGAVLATGLTREQALEWAARAAECVRFRTVHAEALA
jgi:biotin carboxylase